jgi:hypothetical protein
MPNPVLPVIEIAAPGLMSLFIRMSAFGNTLASGTGFVALAPRGPVLVTNWHNLSGRDPETNKPLSNTGGIPDHVEVLHFLHPRSDAWVWQLKKEPLYGADGAPLWKEHPIHGPKRWTWRRCR